MVGLAPDSPFTDDTQMTLFTVEGLIRHSTRGRPLGSGALAATVRNAYLRWWWTQTGQTLTRPASSLDGWLAHDRRLHVRRGPGKTCLSALASGAFGSVEEPINNSKGCGAVMRAAPVGLYARNPERLRETYRAGCAIGALTHGHPDGWGPAGALACMTALLTHDAPILDAARTTLELVSGNTAALLGRAVSLAASRTVTRESVEKELGGGWTGDEALAIAVACAGAFDDPKEAILAAANHSGDSDSTGAICGNLIGALHGFGENGAGVLPCEWLDALRDRDLVRQVAEDFVFDLTENPWNDFTGDEVPRWWRLRYPGS